MSNSIFTYIWEYRVKDEHLDAFEHAYGPDGEWVKLFRQGVGYLKTELHKNTEDPNHFVTVDYWTSKDARDKFRTKYKDQFEAIDKLCESFTEWEKRIGDFNCFQKNSQVL